MALGRLHPNSHSNMMSQSSSAVPPMKLKRGIVRILVYFITVFAVIPTLKEEPSYDGIEKKTTARARVLIARSVSPTETKKCH